MWIGSLRLRVRTKARPEAGTDNLVTVGLLRDGNEVAKLRLDHRYQDDLEPGVSQNFTFTGPSSLPRSHDRPPMNEGTSRKPVYPPYGIEFSQGCKGHLALQATIHGDDLWIKDSVELFVREIRPSIHADGTVTWVESSEWTPVARWGKDAPISGDKREGTRTWTMAA
jgi:hypothetical protein